MREYLDFEIDVSRVGNRLEIDVSGQFGETPQPIQVPYDDRTAERVHHSAAQLAKKNLDSKSLLQYGIELGSLLVPPDVRRIFLRGLANLGGDEGIRLRLKLRDANSGTPRSPAYPGSSLISPRRPTG